MVRVWHVTLLLPLFATVTLADYYIDNANTSLVTYAIPAGQSWQIFSTSTQSLALQLTNSTGNYTITLDSSNCYDENYSLGVCGTGANCYVQIPFTGSGIAMYVFNAGATGMTASFSIDGGPGVVNSINGPTVAENYQVSNVSLYNIQGLPSGNHTMRMTLMDWNGGGTSMKFDYAYVNETFVATPTSTTTSPTSSQTATQSTQTLPDASTATQTPAASASNKLSTGAVAGLVVGPILGITMMVAGVCLYCRRRKASNRKVSGSPPPNIDPFEIDPFSRSPQTHIQHNPRQTQLPEMTSAVPPHVRSAILRDALAAAGQHSSSDLIQERSQSNLPANALQPLRRQPSHNAESDSRDSSGMILRADEGWTSPSAFSDEPALAARYNLTAKQLEVIRTMQANDFPQEEIMRVIDSFVSSPIPVTEVNVRRLGRAGSFTSSAPPPSYMS